MAEEGGERSEEPTQQRREDFRNRGQVAQTRELGSVLLLFTSLLCIWFLGRFFFAQIHSLFQTTIGSGMVPAVRDGSTSALMLQAFKTSAFIVGPMVGILWIMSIASSVLQIGFLTNQEALTFKPERLDPVQGFKRIFSLRSLMEAVKALFKICCVGAIAYMVIKGELAQVPQLVNFTVGQIFSFLGTMIFKLTLGVGTFMAVLAGMDFLFQRWDLEKQMRMTKQEVKEEHKSREGDPLIKARIRRIQREMATRRMMNDVPKADVVITNPTHIAVALRYADNMIAPTVVAKGAGLIAEKIKKIAKENGVPVIENKPLARAMFKTLKIGQMIPKELYTAVAEVLSYVYRLKKKVLK